ncbi:MAG: hypothetical protein ACREDF_03695 [Thermoplasmata archaeon]
MVARVVSEPPVDDRIQRAFEEFHALNPHVYDTLVRLARRYAEKHRKAGIGHLWEVMRWQMFVETTGDEEFRLNNNWKSRYARLIMAREPDLDGLFEIRELRALDFRERWDPDGQGEMFE